MACIRVCVVCCGSVGGVLVFRLGSMRLAVFLSRVMRLSCRVSDLGTGKIYVGVGFGGGGLGHWPSF